MDDAERVGLGHGLAGLQHDVDRLGDGEGPAALERLTRSAPSRNSITMYGRGPRGGRRR